MSEHLTSQEIPDSYTDHPIDKRIQAWAVRRSSGDVEKNWLELGRGVKDGVEFARVFKRDSDGLTLSKDVSLEALHGLKAELDAEKLREKREAKVANLAIEQSGIDTSPDEAERFPYLDPDYEDGLTDQERIRRAAVPLTLEEELVRQRRAEDRHDAAMKRIGRPEMQ